MMNVKAKFKLRSKLHSDTTAHLTFDAVITGSPENESFFRNTPSGYINLSTVNIAAADAFDVDKEYYVTFSPAN